MWWIDILLVVLTCAFACVAIYRGIKLHGKGITSFLVASIVLGAVPSIYSSASPMGRKSALRREIPWILRGFQGRLSC